MRLLSISNNCVIQFRNSALKEDEHEKTQSPGQERKQIFVFYLDNVILQMEKTEGHLNVLRSILGKFKNTGLKLKPKNYKW